MSVTTSTISPRFPVASRAAAPLDGVAEEPLIALRHAGVAVTVAAGAEICDQDAPVRYCHQLVSGCLRIVRLTADGRRLISRFLVAGDLLGFDAQTHHDGAAQAVTATVLRRYPVRAVHDLAGHDTGFARFLWRVAAAELRDARGHALLLGRQTATERVAHFLHVLGRRLAHHGAQIVLPMGRADIADHLGLTVETVSRTLTRLRLDGVIAIAPHIIGIRDADALRALSGEPDAMVRALAHTGMVRH